MILNKRKGSAEVYRVYHVFYYVNCKKFKKNIYDKNVDNAVEKFKRDYNYTPKFARDHWYKEVWTDYSNENSVEE